jgi:uncharacterized protein YdaU (DUF1376 family)
MASELPWFKFFASDYLLDPKVDAIPREAEGLLVRMWCLCHREGSCPVDPETIARKTLCTLQYVLRYKPICDRFFQLRDGKLYSRRMEEEKRKSETARNNANRRYQKQNQKPEPESKSKSESESERGSANGSANGNAIGSARCSSKPSSERVSDPRHAPIREFIKQKQRETNIPEQWDGRSGKALDIWLRANPTVTVETAQRFVSNKFDSDESRGSPPWEWLPRLSKYAEGPLDKFGKVWRPDFRAGYEGMRA